MKNKYPFIPKSTSYLERGQFWAVPLSNGKFCCGAVLHLLSRGNKTKTKVFHAGLLNWVGDKPPTENNVVGKEILHSGAVHIKAITENGSEIIGKINLEPDNEIIQYTDDIGTWGYKVINVLGEKYFGKSR